MEEPDSVMTLKEHVRGELLLSKELLTKSKFGGNPAEEERIAHDIIIADDAAEIAMGAICSQRGFSDQQRRSSISDYFVWLQRLEERSPIAGLEYFSELHKTRMDLQCRFIVPELYKWRGVREATLGFIARWCQDYLHVQVWKVTPATLNRLTSEIRTMGTHRMAKMNAVSVTDMTAKAARRFGFRVKGD